MQWNTLDEDLWSVLNNKTLLITGGTGSFGNAFVRQALKYSNCQKIIIFSRDEMKQWEMQNVFSKFSDRLRFFIGDVRDLDRLKRAFKDVDYIIHAAATKIVPTAEYNPFECIKTNINGAMNIVDAAIDSSVSKVVALSTDKASSPVNLYGATKLVSDKVFIAGNNYSGIQSTNFSVVRYGNVMGSRGSIIPFFRSISSKSRFPITDFKMTRFMISLDDGIRLVMTALNDAVGGELYIKKIKSMYVTDIAKAINPNAKLVQVGIRPGEKLHEQMIGIEDNIYTFEYDHYYKILPMINNWHQDPQRIKNGRRVDEQFVYSSNMNAEWMTVEELQTWISSEYDD